MNESIKSRIAQLKKEKDVVILAHYYVDGEVQEIADYVGDSYYLAEVATKVPESVILFCGVSFMGESAKILNPEKKVIMADRHADCPMAHMVDMKKIEEVRKEYPDVAVVCYVNSTAEIKTASDICVTSSNALKIVKKLPNKDIFFIRIIISEDSLPHSSLKNTLSLMMDTVTYIRRFWQTMSGKQRKHIRMRRCWRIRNVPVMYLDWQIMSAVRLRSLIMRRLLITMNF